MGRSLWPVNIGGPGKWADQATMGRPAPPLLRKKKIKPLGWRVAEIGSTRCARLRPDECAHVSEDERTNTETSCATELRDGLNKPLG